MRSEVGEWLATCVGSPICVLLLSWSLLIYQNQPEVSKRRIDVLTVAILAQSLTHQLGLLLYAILTLIHPANHFGEFCSSLVWILNSSSILQELTLTSIAIFAALTVHDEGPTIKKHHIKYHLVSLTVISACIGVTGILNFEPEGCVFLANEISPKYSLFFNGLRSLLMTTTILSLLTALFRVTCRSSPQSEASSKNSSGAFECQHHQHWEPSSGSCTSDSTNSRACLKKRRLAVDEASGWSTIYSILFVSYVFDHLPLLIISIRPNLLRNFCTPQNLATWLPLLKDTFLPVVLAIFDKMFCRYVAKVYTKQDHSTRSTHGGVDGKFRHFEQDNEYKLQLNLNHGLKFPLSKAVTGACGAGGSLYGRLPNQQTRGRNGATLLGIHQYGRSGLAGGISRYASIAPDVSSYTGSNYDSRQRLECKSPKTRRVTRANSVNNANLRPSLSTEQQHHQQLDSKRKLNGDISESKLDNLMHLDEQSYGCVARRPKHFAKSLDEIREEVPQRKILVQQVSAAAVVVAAALRRNQSFDFRPRYPRIELPFVSSRTYDVKRELAIKKNIQQSNRAYEDDGVGYDTSDDESCDLENRDFDTMSSCRSRARSCCSVTTVANDDFEYFQRKEMKDLSSHVSRPLETKGSMRSFTPRIIEATTRLENSKPIVQSFQLKKKMIPGYSLNDLDRLNVAVAKQPSLSIENLKSILRSSDVSYLDNGEICRHDIGGSAPDFKKIFVTEFI
ncbi:PREDICTED: uncharacterized protein LOC105365938 [Ceratosolen solmsi marchali]|uniref:Uncharacterized protein LOC105365938 n=1 Tax=Ceratosolen solmsi marchali TaxID=326594 RepID=A0AAJ6YQY4_9HYME|nr:PREDICTED: uncharacterized protein LOC105365938 [Ceratosolen solmsi marchali]